MDPPDPAVGKETHGKLGLRLVSWTLTAIFLVSGMTIPSSGNRRIPAHAELLQQSIHAVECAGAIHRVKAKLRAEIAVIR